MAKKIIQQGSTTFRATCTECGTRFTYEREDIMKNYVLAFGAEEVSCPHCGHACRHFGNGNKWPDRSERWTFCPQKQ